MLFLVSQYFASSVNNWRDGVSPPYSYRWSSCAARLPPLMPCKYMMDPERLHSHRTSVEHIHLPYSSLPNHLFPVHRFFHMGCFSRKCKYNITCVSQLQSVLQFFFVSRIYNAILPIVSSVMAHIWFWSHVLRLCNLLAIYLCRISSFLTWYLTWFRKQP